MRDATFDPHGSINRPDAELRMDGAISPSPRPSPED